jgi:hypothetical protein
MWQIIKSKTNSVICSKGFASRGDLKLERLASISYVISIIFRWRLQFIKIISVLKPGDPVYIPRNIRIILIYARIAASV